MTQEQQQLSAILDRMTAACEGVERMAGSVEKLSVAYCLTRMENLERRLAKERGEHAQRIEHLESRMDEASKQFGELKSTLGKIVGDLENEVSKIRMTRENPGV